MNGVIHSSSIFAKRLQAYTRSKHDFLRLPCLNNWCESAEGVQVLFPSQNSSTVENTAAEDLQHGGIWTIGQLLSCCCGISSLCNCQLIGALVVRGCKLYPTHLGKLDNETFRSFGCLYIGLCRCSIVVSSHMLRLECDGLACNR